MHQTIGKWAVVTGCVASLLGAAGCVTQSKMGQKKQSPIWAEADQHVAAEASQEAEPRILPRTHYAAGRLLDKRGDFEGAVSQYRRAVAVNHRYLEAWNRLGVALDRLGRFEEADQAFTQAIFIDPDQPQLRNNLAFSYMLQRRWPDAEAELRNALLLDPEFDRARVNLGLVLAYQHRFDDALAAFAQALPEADAHYNMGLIRRQMGHYDDAVRAFRKALLLDPRLEAATQQIAGIEQTFGKLELQEQARAKSDSEPDAAETGWESPAGLAAADSRVGSGEASGDPSWPSDQVEIVEPAEGTVQEARTDEEECREEEEEEQAASAIENQDLPAETPSGTPEPTAAPGEPPPVDPLPAPRPRIDPVMDEAANLEAFFPEGIAWSGWTIAAQAARSEWVEPPVLGPTAEAMVKLPELPDSALVTAEAPASVWTQPPTLLPATLLRPRETLELALVLDEATMGRPSLFDPFDAMSRLAFSQPTPIEIQTIAVGGGAAFGVFDLERLIGRFTETFRQLKKALIDGLAEWSAAAETPSPDDRQARLTWIRHPDP